MPAEKQSHQSAGPAKPVADQVKTASVFPPAAARALLILTIIACGAAAWATQDFLMPTATAVVVAMALTPIVRTLERLGLPTVVASAIVVASIGAVIAGTTVAIAPGLSELISTAPEIAVTIERKARPLKQWLGNFQAATDKLDQVSQLRTDDGSPKVSAPVQSSGAAVMELAPQVIGQTIYVLVLALFLISVREPYRKRLIMLPATREHRLRMARILNESLSQVSHYLFVMTMINTGVAVAVTLAFELQGVAYAAVWGLAFGIACYIPYVGPTVMIAICTLTQLVTAPTITQALIPSILLLIVNFIESNFVTPWLISRRIAVSSLAVFLTVAMFALLAGPFAAIVAVPLLILFSTVAHHVPGLEPIAILLLPEGETSLETQKSGLKKLFAAESALHAELLPPVVWWRRAFHIGLVRR